MTRLSIVSTATLFFVGVCLLGQQKQSPQATSAALDKMIAAKKSQKDSPSMSSTTTDARAATPLAKTGSWGLQKGKALDQWLRGLHPDADGDERDRAGASRISGPPIRRLRRSASTNSAARCATRSFRARWDLPAWARSSAICIWGAWTWRSS